MTSVNAAALDIIHLLEVEGAKVKAYDPQAMEACRKMLEENHPVRGSLPGG